ASETGRAVPLRPDRARLEAVGRHRAGRPGLGAGAVLQGRVGGGAAEGAHQGAGPGGPSRGGQGEQGVSPEEAGGRLQTVLAHAWMVRTFLKHSEEVQDDEEMLDVHRTLFDTIRAVEPSAQRLDWKEYLRRLKGKLPKVRRVAELFAREYRRITDH